MALEGKWDVVPPQSFTSNGTNHGLITVADTSGFKVKQTAYLTKTATNPLPVQVKRVISSTKLVVGSVDNKIASWVPLDISAYTVVSGAAIGAEEQNKNNIPGDDHYRAIYESDPTCADRVIFVDQYGKFYDETNPLPIIFDGTITVGNVKVTNFPDTVDTNYGVVGSSTIRTASQIGNATGAANFGVGLTTAQTLRVVLPTDQSAIPVTQSGPWSVSVSNLPAYDTNYGTVGALTLRTASQIGNATGAADFGAGLTTAQTLRVVIPTDQTTIPVAIVSGGGVADKSAFTYGVNNETPIGGVYQDALPTLSAGQTGAVRSTQYRALHVNLRDSSGNEKLAQQTSALSIPVVLPTDQSPIPVTQSGPWSVSVSNFPAYDTNYGTVGALTLRTASQIGNATGSAAFGAGTTTAQVLRVVLPTDQSPIPVTQSGVWTTGRTWNLSSGIDSATVIQGTSPWIISGTVTAAEDKNYGTVGANTLRTAAQIGNATGSADFNIGATGAQTLRVSANIARNGNELSYNAGASDANTLRSAVNIKREGNELDYNFGAASANSLRVASLIGNATGAAAFGAGLTTAQTLRVVLPTDQTSIPVTQSTSPWVTSDLADGPVTPGAVASKSMLAGGQFNTTPPTLANTQQSALQLTSTGRLNTNVDQKTVISTSNSSTANLASSATFTGTSENAATINGIHINFKADANCTVQCQQSSDGTNWDVVDNYNTTAGIGDGRAIQITSAFFRVLVTNNDLISTTFLRLQTILIPIATVLPRALSGDGKLSTTNMAPNGIPGMAHGKVTTNAVAVVRNTAYVEQTTNAQRSVVSSSASDAAAGTGARTIRITYLDSNYKGFYTETLTLNGTTAVNTVNTNICFVEKIEVLSTGSFGANVGVVSIKTTTGGGGTTFFSIAVADNVTFQCHHYVPAGKTGYIQSINVNSSAGNAALFHFIWSDDKTGFNTGRIDEIRCPSGGSFTRRYENPIPITGGLGYHVTVLVTPDANGGTYYATIEYHDA